MLRFDLVAGLSVALASLPLAMAFAVAAGLGPGVGLVSAIIAGGVAALCGGSELNITGPTGSLIGVIAGVLVSNDIGGYNDVLVLGMLGGVMLIVAGLSGVGRLIRLVPLPVILGFTGGIGVIILVSQLEDALGLPGLAKGLNFHETVGAIFGASERVVLAAIAVTVLAIGLIEVIGRALSQAFAPILGIAATSIAAWALGLDVVTLEDKYDAIPRSLPSPALPDLTLEQITRLLPAASTMAALCALESLLSASASDVSAGKRHNSKAELIGCGLANMTSPLFGGIPGCGAMARTTLNFRSGAQTRLAGVFNALALLLIMLFIAPIVGKVPTAALAGLLISIALRMVDIKTCRKLLAQHHWTDFAMMAVTLLATVFVSVVVGLACGLAVAALAYQARVRGGRPASVHHIRVREAQPAPTPANRDEEATDATRVAVVCLNGPLFFHTARRQLEAASSPTPASAVVLCLRDTDVIDASGIQALKDILNVHRQERFVCLAGVSDTQRALLKGTGIIDMLGVRGMLAYERDAFVFITREAAVRAALGAQAEAELAVSLIESMELYEGKAVGVAGRLGRTYSALRAIVALGPSATPYLLRLIGSENPVARVAGIVGLGQIQVPGAYAAVERLVQDESYLHTFEYSFREVKTVGEYARKTLSWWWSDAPP